MAFAPKDSGLAGLGQLKAPQHAKAHVTENNPSLTQAGSSMLENNMRSSLQKDRQERDA